MAHPGALHENTATALRAALIFAGRLRWCTHSALHITLTGIRVCAATVFPKNCIHHLPSQVECVPEYNNLDYPVVHVVPPHQHNKYAVAS